MRKEKLEQIALGTSLVASGLGCLAIGVSEFKSGGNWLSYWQEASFVAGCLGLTGTGVYVAATASEAVESKELVDQNS